MAKQESPEISIFLMAIETESAEELAAYLDDACGQNAQLRGRVEALVRTHQVGNSFLEQPAPGMDHTVDVSGDALGAGLAAAFSAGTAIVLGDAGHSVLKSLGKQLPEVPHVALREAAGEEDQVVQPGSKEVPANPQKSRYQLLGEIARGGMGAIIKGRDTDLGRDLAIKVLLESHQDRPEVVQRFVEEAQIGGQLQHPGIVPVYELGRFDEGRPFISMKLVRGETLAALLAKRAKPSEDHPKLLGIFEHVCQTMAYAHNKGVIHRDLKPANIMVGAFGEVQVMDWGLSKLLGVGGIDDERKSLDKHRDQSVIRTRRSTGSDTPGEVGSQTQMGSVLGTLAYMPPEQALGEVERLDERADVFGLGAILAEILTGKPPYVADSDTGRYHLARCGKLDDCVARLDASGAEPELIELAKTALSPEQEDRPRDANELSAAITEHLEGVQERLRQAEVDKERRKKKLYLAIAGSMLILAMAGAIGTVLFKRAADAQSRLARFEAKRANEQERHADEQAKLTAKEIQARHVAEKARIEADDARESEVLAHQVQMLVARSEGIKDLFPIQGTLLAMEAFEMGMRQKGAPMMSAHETLLRTLSNLGGVPLQIRADRVNQFLISENDRLVMASDDGVRLWDLSAKDPAFSSIVAKPETGESIWPEAVSSDGQWLVAVEAESRAVAVNTECTVRVWELTSRGDHIASRIDLPGHVAPTKAAISHDGKRVVTSSNGTIRLWNLGTEEPMPPIELGQHDNPWAVAIGPSDRWVVAVFANGARLWDLESVDPASSERRFEHAAYRPSVAISPDSRWLVMGTDDGTRLCDLSAEDIATVECLLPGKEIRSVAISSDGHWLVTGGGVARLFDLSSPDPAASAVVLRGHEWIVNSVAISRDGRWLITGSADKTARIWDLEAVDLSELPVVIEQGESNVRLWDVEAAPDTGWSRILRGHDDQVKALAITSGSRRLITGGWDGNVRLWDLESENPGSSTVLRGHKGAILSVAFSPDGRWMVTGSEDGTARLWNRLTDDLGASPIILEGHQGGVRHIAISPNSRWLATAGGKRHFAKQPTKTTTVQVWDLIAKAPSQSRRILSGHKGLIRGLEMGPNNRWLVAWSQNEPVWVWDLNAQPMEAPRVLNHHDTVRSVEFGSDGNSLVTGTLDGTLRRWDLNEDDPITPKIILEQDALILAIALNGGDPRVVTGGWQKPTRIWDLDLNSATGSSFRELTLRETGVFWPVAISTDSRLVGTQQYNTATVWDLSTAGPKSSPYLTHIHDGTIHANVFSPDSRWYATVGEDGCARVSNLFANDPASTTLVLRGHGGIVSSVAISPDSHWMVTGGSDHTARLWELDIDTLMQRARKLVGRELTQQERARYTDLKGRSN